MSYTGQPCSKPNPRYVEGGTDTDYPFQVHRERFICDDCSFTLGVIQYEQGGNLMQWWRHDPRGGPVPMA